MAKKAISVMRDHPLHDGSVLYVREDHQEENNSKSLGASNRRGSTPPDSQWRCADEENMRALSSDDLLLVKNLIRARDQARKRPVMMVGEGNGLV